MKSNELKQIRFDRRLDVLEMVWNAKAGHIGGSMSCIDILVCLYYQCMDIEKIHMNASDRDRFILSKGHCAEALYAILAGQGFIQKETLKTFAAFDSILAEHPTRKVAGVEAATGALGHGLSMGVGMALALKADKSPAKVYVLMGDGEQAEGSVWEAAMSAAKYKLNNLIAIIDRNRLQISGSTEEVMPLDCLKDKYIAFGWDCRVCNGHDMDALIQALSQPSNNKPIIIITETIKGYGSPIMEGKIDWHHLIPTEHEYEQIKADLIALKGRG